MSQSPSHPTVARPRHRTRWLLAGGGLAAAVVVAVGVAVSLGSGPGTNTPSPTAKAPSRTATGSIELFDVSRSDFEIATTATGDLRARTQIEIRNSLESETTITEIIPEGTSVKKGDVLVKLNAETIQTRLDEESLALENARAAVVEANEAYEIQLSENESAKRAANLKLALAELELQKWQQGELKSKEQELRHNLDRAQKDEVRLREYYDRSKLLQEKEFYSLDKLKQDQLALDQAVAAREKAALAQVIHEEFEKPKDLKQKTSDVEEARAEVDRVVRQNSSKIASKEADKKNKQQSFTIREQKFAKYQEQIEAATIKAPRDGLVVYSSSLDNMRWGGDEGPLQVGSKVWPNQTLIVLPDTSEMIAAVKVHESLAGRIRKGQPATVKIDAAGDKRFTGTVESVGILAEQTNRWMDPTLREYTVRVALDIPREMTVGAEGAPATTGDAAPPPTGHGLRPSMRCEAEIVLGKVADVVTVPIQAVHSEGLLRYVHVADSSGSRFTRRPVQVGQRSDRFAEIRAGVAPGDRVLLRKPDAGEVTDKAWDSKQLAAVGLEINSSGDMVPIGGGGAAAGRGAGQGAGQRPGKGGRDAQPPADAPSVSKAAPAAKPSDAAASNTEAATAAPVAAEAATASENSATPAK